MSPRRPSAGREVKCSYVLQGSYGSRGASITGVVAVVGSVGGVRRQKGECMRSGGLAEDVLMADVCQSRPASNQPPARAPEIVPTPGRTVLPLSAPILNASPRRLAQPLRTVPHPPAGLCSLRCILIQAQDELCSFISPCSVRVAPSQSEIERRPSRGFGAPILARCRDESHMTN